MDGGPALTAVAGPRGAGGASGVEGDSSFSEYLEKYCVHVCKQDFKFNAAHFVAYKGFREKLHGHSTPCQRTRSCCACALAARGAAIRRL